MATLKRYLKRRRETGDVRAKPILGRPAKTGARFPTLILVGKNRESQLVVLEGHIRLTAMFLAPFCLPAELEVMVGFSEQIEHWGCY